VADYNQLGSGARDQLIKWARDAATSHGADLSPFFSVVACTNLWSDIGAPADLAGVVAQGRTTQIPRLLGHEMGHVYGLNHSRINGSVADYQDPWDIMSAANDFTTPDNEFSSIGPGINAWNMRSRGWLDESRVWQATNGGYDETITLRPLVRHDLEGYLAAEIPGGYLVEFRVQEEWDAGIPRPAVAGPPLRRWPLLSDAGQSRELRSSRRRQLRRPRARDSAPRQILVRFVSTDRRNFDRHQETGGDPEASLPPGGSHLRASRRPHVSDSVREGLPHLGRATLSSCAESRRG